MSAVVSVAWLPLAVVAADKPAEPPKSPVPPPPKVQPKDAPADEARPESGLEPEVTIVTKGDTRFEEHRIHGRLYMIKVIPKGGKPYYLMDKAGNGDFTRSDLEPSISVPTWVIKSW
jgi:hypothetical protein